MDAKSELTQIFQEDYNNGVSREEVEAALAKAVELRAIHAALLQGIINNNNNNSPANLNFLANSSSSPASNHFSAQDYPIFTPSYEDASFPGPKQLQLHNQTYAEIQDEYGLGGAKNGDEASLSSYRKANSSLRNGILPNSITSECLVDDQGSFTGSCADHITVLRASPAGDSFKPMRNSLGDLRSRSSCNWRKHALISTETDVASKSGKSSNIIVPLTDSHSSVQLQPKSKGQYFSRLFPKFNKKNKNGNSPNRKDQSEQVSQMFKDMGLVSIETLKKELMEANESRDAALMEGAEMKSSLGELKRKLEYLETYCEELKKALRQAVQEKVSRVSTLLPKRGKSTNGDGENTIPVTEEVMVEGFLQMVSESRLSVKQFCKTLIAQIQETDDSLADNLNALLQPYKISINSKQSKAVLYHIEAIINQTLYQDFENVVFQKNGAPKHFDPQQECHANFSSFVSLRNLSWNEVLRKGTEYYSEDFSRFCDKKMSCIITTLNWTRPWPEQLLQAFFIAAKCIWLLHLLAFSFDPPLRIFRVEENTSFDKDYVEDTFADRQKLQGSRKVKIMVMPGFYVHDRVLRCKVICRYNKSAA